ATPATLLRDGDRVEVYRPLLVNPKEVRRRRAQQAGKPGAGGA
ncbi:MAG TPA: RnfH family protein, partial [Tahibacter sp.]|nr:RnfH family protein [Tahibacter sp.]